MSARIPLLFCGLVLAITRSGFSRFQSDPDSAMAPFKCTLTIQTTPESVYVLLDGRAIGITPMEIDSVGAGTHILVLQHPDVESWLAIPLEDTIVVKEGEARTLRYALRTRYLVATTPFGADVILGDSVIGTTPYVAPAGLTHKSLFLRKPGYESVDVTLSGKPVISTSLNKVWQNEEQASYFVESSKTGSNAVYLYISGAATVLSGVAAAYFKVKADDQYQQYQRTGNNNFLSQTHRLDTAAGISIAVTQISLGLFTYFILSQ